MSRGLGAIEALRALLPEWGVDAFAAATVLGDTAFLLVVFLALYWFYDREEGALALAVFLCGVVLMAGLKAAFALPRPPEPLRAVAVDGYGFPSGHAFGATVGFGLVALVVRAGSRLRRGALAALGAVIVSVSRVAIGVHYAVDVIAGVALGVAYLAVAWRVVWPRRDAISESLARIRTRR